MLRKKQTLSNKKDISKLFSKGFKSSCFPLVMFSMPFEKDQVLFSVSKKNISKASDRNKIKRQMKAIYFNNLELFLNDQPKATALTYVSKKKSSFIEINKSMKELFNLKT